MKITKTKSTTEKITYHLGNKVTLVETIVDGEQKRRKLKYSGPKLFGYEVSPIYGVDLAVLEKTNPYWGIDGYSWFETEIPSDPKDIDLSKIIFGQGASHSFFDFNLEPIPVVIKGDYIDARISSRCYDLFALHAHLRACPQVKSISEIQKVPYYNAEYSGEECFEVLVLPTVEQLKEIGISKNEIFYDPWKKKDYLGMKPFRISEE
jgi:hypothetical protein